MEGLNEANGQERCRQVNLGLVGTIVCWPDDYASVGEVKLLVPEVASRLLHYRPQSRESVSVRGSWAVDHMS